MIYASGDSYGGSWQNDMREGQGKMTFVNGDTYEGSWSKDVRAGQGKMIFAVDCETSDYQPGCNYTWSAGDIYEGAFEADMRHGASTYTFFNGETAKFTWVHGICPKFNARQAKILLAQPMVHVLSVL